MGLCDMCSRTCQKPNSIAYPPCSLCGGLFSSLESACSKCKDSLAGTEWKTFSTGCIIPKKILAAQERLWLEGGLENSTHIKNIINSEAGRLISENSGRKQDLKNPDVFFTLGLESGKCTARISPIFIYGHYRKYSREVSQSIWHCKKCNGTGRKKGKTGGSGSASAREACSACSGKGVLYDSVEGIAGEHMRKAFQGDSTSFHSSGREDIDAVMRGRGRPFAIEIKNPRKRKADLNAIAREINLDGRVKVSRPAYVSQKFVKAMCNSHFDKEYSAEVSFQGEVSKSHLKKILSLSGKTIFQQTPVRVLHRRADLTRKRKILSISGKLKGASAILRIKAQAGTYIKEFVSGDSGRTRPSVSGTIGIPAKVEKLDVARIEDGFLSRIKKK